MRRLFLALALTLSLVAAPAVVSIVASEVAPEANVQLDAAAEAHSQPYCHSGTRFHYSGGRYWRMTLWYYGSSTSSGVSVRYRHTDGFWTHYVWKWCSWSSLR